MTAAGSCSEGFVVGAEAGETLFAMGALVTIMVPAAATGGRFAVLEHTVPPTGGPPPHTHAAFEYLHVIEGEFEAWVGDLTGPTRAEAGATILVPPGVPHTTRNSGARAGRLLSIYSPAGDEDFFRAVGVPLAELPAAPGLDQPPDLSVLDPARVRALAERYGMRLVAWPAPA